MEVGILRIIFFALFIGAAYLILKLISKLSDGKVKADFFAGKSILTALILNIVFLYAIHLTAAIFFCMDLTILKLF